MELAEAKCRDTTRVTTDCYIYTRSGWGTAIKSDPKIIIIPSINAREETDRTIQAQDLSIPIGAQNHHRPTPSAIESNEQFRVTSLHALLLF